MILVDEFDITETKQINWSDMESLQVAELIFAASPEFYTVLGHSVEHLAVSIRQSGKIDPECERTFVARHDATIVGLVGVIAAERVRGAQMAAVRNAVAEDRDRRRIILEGYAAYAADVQPLASAGTYLSRVAVAPTQRGTGLAATLIQAALDKIGTGSFGLHVRSDHPGVVEFYKKAGFLLINQPHTFLYSAMLHNSGSDVR